jgi:hypothetical protein
MATNNFWQKVESINKLEVEIAKAETRYSTLSELWDCKSKAKIHVDISKKLDEAIVKVDNLRKLKKEIETEIEKFGK